MAFYKLVPEDTRHRQNYIFFSADRELLYGRDENDLSYPAAQELYGRFPICIKDLKNAFRLGKQVGSKEVKDEQG